MKTFISILLTGLICLNNYNLSAQNAPISTIGAVETYDDTALVSVTVTDFLNIGSCELVMNYDSTLATATSVTLGPGIGYYYFLVGIDTPGKIAVTWLFLQYNVPGVTLPDSSVFLNITFDRAGYGNSPIEFDNSLPDNCLWGDSIFDELNDLPYSTYYIDGSLDFKMIDAPITSAPSLESCQGSASVDVPVTVSDFNQIGAFNLTLQYDDQSFSYQSYTNDSGFPGMDVIENDSGTIVITGLSDSTDGVSLSDDSILFTLHFNNLGGSTAISWLDDGESCKYSGSAPAYEPRNDDPQSYFYINGLYTELPLPEDAGNIVGPPSGSVCQGENDVSFSVAPILYADSYAWTLPVGATITSGDNTNEIIVSFSEDAVSGDVSVYGINDCGNGNPSPSFPLEVETIPSPAGTITGPAGGMICQGETGVVFNVSPILYADNYFWTLPDGASITSGENTNEIIVSFSENAVSGNVSVYGSNECGNGVVSPFFALEVDTPPSISIQPESPDTVYAGNGIASFSVTATGSNLSFQWQEYSNDWVEVFDGGVYTGTSTSVLTITNPPISMNGYHYRCIVSGNCAPDAVSDGTATLTVVDNTGVNVITFNTGFGSDGLSFSAFPNPFSEQITFSFIAPTSGNAAIELSNIYGEKVANISLEIQSKSEQKITLGKLKLKPGIYFANLVFQHDNLWIRNTLKIISDIDKP